MVLRAMALAGGVAGAAALSQFPEYSQQYTQRLAGAVDELSRVVADFDASARTLGLSREDALAQMVGTPFVERRRSDMTRTLARHTRLRDDLLALREASVLERVRMAPRLTDPEIAARAWDDFTPGVPVTAVGLGLAAAGFVAGWGLIALLLSVLMRPFRRIA